MKSLYHLIGAVLLAMALHGAAVAQPRPGFTPPDRATFGAIIEKGDLQQARAWLDAGLDPDYIGDRIGTGLMIAAWEGNIPMMQLFLDRGANVNRENNRGERALMHAAWRGQQEAVEWLLAKGAEVNSPPGQWSALHYAAFAGHEKVANLLLAFGADINARSANGSTPLMMAVYENQEPLVRQLTASGADTTLKNDRGEGALEWAFKFGRLSIARMVAPPKEFAAAASKPAAAWEAGLRSLPLPSPAEALKPPAPAPDPLARQIADLVNRRNLLASRGVTKPLPQLDRRIAALRAKRARGDMDVPSILEITARRAAPTDQSTRLINSK